MKIRFLLVFMLVLAMYSCSAVPDSGTQGSVEESASAYERCIPPITEFAFPTNTKTATIHGPTQKLPMDPWALEAALPGLPNKTTSIDNVLFTRTTSSYTEVWIMRDQYVSEGTALSKERTLFVYRTDKKEWNTIPFAVDGVPGEISKLFMTDDQIIWVSVSTPSETILVKFDDQKKTFEIIDEYVPKGRVFLNQEMFWIFSEETIFSLDSKTLKLEKRVDTPGLEAGFDNGVAFAPDGSIYFINSYREIVNKSDVELYHFVPQNNSIDRILNIDLQNQSPFFSLFVDRGGNLWVSDHGWMSKDGSWYEVVRSPLFITDRMPEHPTLFWQHPNIVLESSDGQLWFDSYNGMVSLNPRKGEWCWFTTYQSNIIEDSDHNLWMIADGKLYKLALGK